MDRRHFLGLGLSSAGLAVLGGRASVGRPSVGWRESHSSLRGPGSLPDPSIPIGTDTIPQIEHIVLVTFENHSYDSVLGMLPGRGDGFSTFGGVPRAANKAADGQVVRAFEMPTPCQIPGEPNNSWQSMHVSFDHGRNDGFVEASGPVAMGYFTDRDLPFTWGVATTFPICDRYFCSVLADSYPNHRYLYTGTSLGIIGDAPTYPDSLVPPNGTILDQLNAHGITWRDYFTSGLTIPTYLFEEPAGSSRLSPVEQFYADAASGNLPQFAVVEPNYGKSSEENPQDVRFGDQFFAAVVNAVLSGPCWSRTLLVWLYDESGGYYDHVVPPPALPPDDYPPNLTVGQSYPGGFDRYGFRVPCGVISPYARPDYVSHVVHDHTSVLKLLETKWNLPALTYRDANASDLLDCVDLSSPPAFLRPPELPAGADPGQSASCLSTGPGTIPPPSSVRRRR